MIGKRLKPWTLAESLRHDEPPVHGKMASAVANAVSRALKDDSRSRDELADDLSLFIEEAVSRQMLDGYASIARGRVNISFHRFAALITLTGRWDLFDEIRQRFSIRVATPRDVKLLELGVLFSERSKIDAMISERLA